MHWISGSMAQLDTGWETSFQQMCNADTENCGEKTRSDKGGYLPDYFICIRGSGFNSQDLIV